MTKKIINPYVTINAVDLSDHIGAVTISDSADAIETTAGGSTRRARIGGLQDAEMSLDIHNDYANASVYHTVAALVGGTTNVVVKPRDATTDTDNPQWTCEVVVTDFSRISGSVGDLDEYSVTWPVNDITEALS